MADATITAPTSDPIIEINIDEIKIRPGKQIIFYRLELVRESGATEYSEKAIAAADFGGNLSAWAQAQPRRKFLNWLVANGYESNLTVS